MNKIDLKIKLEKSELFTNDSSIRALLNGTRFPSYSKAVKLEENQGIPIEVWKDIKSYMESVSEVENECEVQDNQ